MPLEQGSIVWARVSDSSGRNVKSRPVVVVTKTDQITPLDTVQAVAVTSQIVDPQPENRVALPWHRARHPRTGLNRPCTAVCDWIVEIDQHDVETIVGRVPTSELREILSKVVLRSQKIAASEEKSETLDAAAAPPDDSPPSPEIKPGDSNVS